MTGSRAAGLVHTATRRLVQDDLDGFAAVSGDDNPIHVDPRFAATTPFEVPVAHGMHLYGLVRAQLRAVFGDVPQRAQELMFPAPTPVGATVIVHLEGEEVEHIEADLVRVATRVTHGEQVGLVGRATLGAPGRAPRDPPADAPSVRALDVSDHGHGSSWWTSAATGR
jgi:acyl dehydratase